METQATNSKQAAIDAGVDPDVFVDIEDVGEAQAQQLAGSIQASSLREVTNAQTQALSNITPSAVVIDRTTQIDYADLETDPTVTVTGEVTVRVDVDNELGVSDSQYTYDLLVTFDDYETPDGYRLFGQTTYVGDLSSRAEDIQTEPRVSSTYDLDIEGGTTVEDGGNAYAFTYIVDFALEMVDSEVQSCSIAYTLNDRSIADEDCSGFTGFQPAVGS